MTQEFEYVEANGDKVSFQFFNGLGGELAVSIVLTTDDNESGSWATIMKEQFSLPFNLRLSDECKNYIQRIANNLVFA